MLALDRLGAVVEPEPVALWDAIFLYTLNGVEGFRISDHDGQPLNLGAIALRLFDEAVPVPPYIASSNGRLHEDLLLRARAQTNESLSAKSE
jgi:hypothetical protein